MIVHETNVLTSKLSSKDIDNRKFDDFLPLEPQQTPWSLNEEFNSYSDGELSSELDSLQIGRHKKHSIPLVKDGFLVQDVKVSVQRLEHVKAVEVQSLYLKANLYNKHSVKKAIKKKTTKKLSKANANIVFKA